MCFYHKSNCVFGFCHFEFFPYQLQCLVLTRILLGLSFRIFAKRSGHKPESTAQITSFVPQSCTWILLKMKGKRKDGRHVHAFATWTQRKSKVHGGPRLLHTTVQRRLVCLPPRVCVRAHRQQNKMQTECSGLQARTTENF